MKRILINALILSKKNTGLGVYTLNVLNYLIPRLNNNLDLEYKIVCSDKIFLKDFAIQDNNIIEIECKNSIERNYKINKLISSSKEKYDLVYSSTQHGVVNRNVLQIITIHDLMPLFFPKGRYHQYLYYKLLLPLIIKKASKIVTVSNSSKKDINSNYKVTKDKIEVIYCGTNELNYTTDKICECLEKYNLLPKDYILLVGIHYSYKNIHSVIKALAQDERLKKEKIVIVGGYDNEYGRYLKKLVDELNMQNRVTFTNFISDYEKDCLYKNAKCFVYPSKYEGFGLPVLEAMAYGIPVVSSNTSSLPEVAGDAVLFFNPMDIVDIGNKIADLLQSTELQKELIEKGNKNLQRFSWEKTADEVYNLILKTLE